MTLKGGEVFRECLQCQDVYEKKSKGLEGHALATLKPPILTAGRMQQLLRHLKCPHVHSDVRERAENDLQKSSKTAIVHKLKLKADEILILVEKKCEVSTGAPSFSFGCQCCEAINAVNAHLVFHGSSNVILPTGRPSIRFSSSTWRPALSTASAASNRQHSWQSSSTFSLLCLLTTKCRRSGTSYKDSQRCADQGSRKVVERDAKPG